MDYLQGKVFSLYEPDYKSLNGLFKRSFNNYLNDGLNEQEAERKALDECYLVTPLAEEGKAFASCHWCGNEIIQGESFAAEAGIYFHYDTRKKEECCFMVSKNAMEGKETETAGSSGTE